MTSTSGLHSNNPSSNLAIGLSQESQILTRACGARAEPKQLSRGCLGYLLYDLDTGVYPLIETLIEERL